MERPRSRASGFTLVELVIVIGLLAVVAAVAVPLLVNSFRGRNLNQEAERFVALTEYGRDEAVSQGVPMTVWVDPKGQRFGVEPKSGFEGEEARAKDFELGADIHFEVDRPATHNGVADVMEFSPDGSLASSSIDMVRLIDRFETEVTVARASDLWSYEILKEQR